MQEYSCKCQSRPTAKLIKNSARSSPQFAGPPICHNVISLRDCRSLIVGLPRLNPVSVVSIWSSSDGFASHATRPPRRKRKSFGRFPIQNWGPKQHRRGADDRAPDTRGKEAAFESVQNAGCSINAVTENQHHECLCQYHNSRDATNAGGDRRSARGPRNERGIHQLRILWR